MTRWRNQLRKYVDLKKRASRRRKQPTTKQRQLRSAKTIYLENKLRGNLPTFMQSVGIGPKNMVLCKLCSVELAYDSSITAMHEHLKKKQLGVLCKDNILEQDSTAVFTFCPHQEFNIFSYQHMCNMHLLVVTDFLMLNVSSSVPC